MATDKRLDQVSQLTDFDYALIVKGTDVAKVTKQQFAELVGNLLYGATNKNDLATVVAGVLNCVCTKAYVLGVGSSIQLPNDIGIIMITSIGSTFIGSAIVNAGGGVPQDQLKMVSNTSTVVGIGTTYKIGITRSHQWGDISIVNNDNVGHNISLTTIRY